MNKKRGPGWAIKVSLSFERALNMRGTVGLEESDENFACFGKFIILTFAFKIQLFFRKSPSPGNGHSFKKILLKMFRIFLAVVVVRKNSCFGNFGESFE